MAPTKVPHPIPYQGSKRWIAGDICRCLPADIGTLYEPFAGSAAVTLCAATWALAPRFVVADVHRPLVDLWQAILDEPDELCRAYAAIWSDQQADGGRETFLRVRAEFNRQPRPPLFLYLLARCVKAAIRYNGKGEFNNTADHRRAGAKPQTMAAHVHAAARVLAGRTSVGCGDFLSTIESATPADVIYMDPPYQGTSTKRDGRYIKGLSYDQFCSGLRSLADRRLSYIISYDGRTGDKVYGEHLPDDLGLVRFEVEAGRSTQGTLLGRAATTYESVYISRPLLDRIGSVPFASTDSSREAEALLF